MCHDSFDDWEPETLHEQAVRALVNTHREEYDELTGRFREERVQSLENQILGLSKELAYLRGQNPDAVSVPALTDTVNGLVDANNELTAENRKLKLKVGNLERSLDAIGKAVKKEDDE